MNRPTAHRPDQSATPPAPHDPATPSSTATGPTTPDTPGLVNVTTAAAMLGIGRTLAYRLVRENRFPVPTIRVGRLVRIPVAALRELIEHGTPPAA